MGVYKKGEPLSQEQAQNLAVQVALGGAGFVSPNPLVGCVIVDRNHHFLASGYHQQYGGPHAEVHAFRSLDSSELEGSTVYVTLEPCSHHGKTPPCAELFMNKKIKKVIVGCMDPNPLVAGQGLKILRENGIQVETSIPFTKQCTQLAEIFLWHIQNKSPFVALKIAMSSDGFTAQENKKPTAITSEVSRLWARKLRAHYDATLIGAETFLQDNPRLDYRDTAWHGTKSPKVVILDPRGRAEAFLPQSLLAQTVKRENIHFIKKVDKESLQHLYKMGLYSLYVEGGTQTHRLFIDQGLFQKVYCFVSAKSLHKGHPWVYAPQQLDTVFDIGERQNLGDEKLYIGRPRQ